MTQRNPLNERNTLEGRKAGVTRKSAASAKPVTKAAASVRTAPKKPEKKGLFSSGGSQSEPAKEKKVKASELTPVNDTASKEKKDGVMSAERRAQRKAERQHRRAIQNFTPDTPEFKEKNRKRLIYSSVGFVGMILAIILSFLVPDNMWVSIIVMLIAWLFFFMGVRIDTQELRPLRERGYAQHMRKMAHKAKKK